MNINTQIPVEIIENRLVRIQSLLKNQHIDAMLVSSNANLYYTSGRIISGYTYIPADGEVQYFVRRPVGLTGKNVHYIGKPEHITEILTQIGVGVPSELGMELDLISVSLADRLAKVFPNANNK